MHRASVVNVVCLALAGQAVAADEIRIAVEAVPSAESLNRISPFATIDVVSSCAPPEAFTLEPLYPAQDNEESAKLVVNYSCVDSLTGEKIIPCDIVLDPPVAREDTGGHVAPHLDGRPTGRNEPTSGSVDANGDFRSTYFSSEIAGVVDVAINVYPAPPYIPVVGTVAFGVTFQGLEDLGAGVGYVLTGAKSQHPSNHWGVAGFNAAVQSVAAQFAIEYPDNPFSYNDISLECGGVFDVQTRTQTGYDWTPPHKTHRVGKNMDMSIPPTSVQQERAEELFQIAGVDVFREDRYHWHLTLIP
jgi:hypothetical protein